MNFFAWIHSRYYTLQAKPKILNTAASVRYLYFDVLLQRRQQSCQFSFDAGCRVVEDSVAGLRQAVGAEQQQITNVLVLGRRHLQRTLRRFTWAADPGNRDNETRMLYILTMMLFFHFTIFYILLSCLFNHSCNTVKGQLTWHNTMFVLPSETKQGTEPDRRSEPNTVLKYLKKR